MKLNQLQQLLTLRRQRETLAAAVLGEARRRLEAAEARRIRVERRQDSHRLERRVRQEEIYRSWRTGRLSRRDVDHLNIQLDLLDERSETLAGQLHEAEAAVDQAVAAVEQAERTHRCCRLAAERFGHLVDDLALTRSRLADEAKTASAEDDLAWARPPTFDGAR